MAALANIKPKEYVQSLRSGAKLVILIAIFGVPSLSAHQCRKTIEQFAGVMDPYGSGLLYKAELEKRGITPIAVIGSRQTPSGYTFNPDDWKRVIVFTTPEQTAAELLATGKHFRALYDGADSGTVNSASIRDAIRAKGIATIGNSGRLAWARRDKVESAKVLGDLAPIQFEASDLPATLHFAEKLGYPVVIKPNRNAGGTGVRTCRNANQVIQAFEAIHPNQGQNGMLETDTAVIVQEYLPGAEEAFNGVRAADGTVVFSGIWKYRRNRSGQFPNYVADRIQNPNTPKHLAAREEIVLAAEKLEIVGPFHIEKKKKIIDVGARLSGGGLPKLEAATTNLDPVALAVDSYLDPDFLKTMPSAYTLNSFGAAVFITTRGNATASHRLMPDLETLKKAGLVVDYDFHWPEKAPLERTTDSDSVVATVLINARTFAEREKLIAKILEWRDNGLFENK